MINVSLGGTCLDARLFCNLLDAMQDLQKLGPYILGQSPGRRWRSSAGHHQMCHVSPASGLQGWGLMNVLPKSLENKSMQYASEFHHIYSILAWPPNLAHCMDVCNRSMVIQFPCLWSTFYAACASQFSTPMEFTTGFEAPITPCTSLHYPLSALTSDRCYCYYKGAFCTEWRMPSRQSISPSRKITGDSMGRIVSLSQNENLECANLEQPKRVVATEWDWMNWMIPAALMLVDVSSIKEWNSTGDEWRVLSLQWLCLALLLTRLIV